MLKRLQVEGVAHGLYIHGLGAATIEVMEDEVEPLLLVLQAYYNIIRLKLPLEKELYSYEEYVLIRQSLYTYIVVGYTTVLNDPFYKVGDSMIVTESVRSLSSLST